MERVALQIVALARTAYELVVESGIVGNDDRTIAVRGFEGAAHLCEKRSERVQFADCTARRVVGIDPVKLSDAGSMFSPGEGSM